MEIDMLENTKGTIIKVIGVGGAGGNAVQHMINNGGLATNEGMVHGEFLNRRNTAINQQ